MNYKTNYDRKAMAQLKKLEKSGKKIDMAKVVRFIAEVKVHPHTGAGNPERLKHQKNGKETWSRTVNKKDRFIYDILEEDMEILVTQVLGHYEDK